MCAKKKKKKKSILGGQPTGNGADGLFAVGLLHVLHDLQHYSMYREVPFLCVGKEFYGAIVK